MGFGSKAGFAWGPAAANLPDHIAPDEPDSSVNQITTTNETPSLDAPTVSYTIT